MGKRKAKDDEWELHKEEILGLYMKFTLSAVMKIMIDRGFKKTKSQYERRINKWRNADLNPAGKIKTNVKKEEWEYISYRLRQRKKEGKPSEVTVRGFHITPQRIKHQAYEPVYHRYIPQEHITIPSDVVVFTAPGQPGSPSLIQQKDLLYLRFQNTAWQQLTSWMDDLLISSEGTTMGMLPLVPLSSSIREPTNPNASIDASSSIYLDGCIFLSSTRGNDPVAEVPMMERVLPTHRALLPKVETEHASGLTTINTQVELLKQLVGLISNAHDDDVLIDRTHELTSDPRNLVFLNRLISKEQLATKAFAEKLLMISLGDYSIYDRPPNIALMRVLLDSGCDINYEGAGGYSLLGRAYYFLRYPGLVPLEKHEEIFDELLIRGASWEGLSKPQDLLDNWDHQPSPFDIIVKVGDESTVQMFFDSFQKLEISLPGITIGTFIIAAYIGNVSYFRSLAMMEPVLQGKLRRSPWLLFEAAASGKNATIMTEYLCRDGFDMMAVDKQGRGNPLVFALLSRSESLGAFLRTGSYTHNYANGEMLTYLGEQEVIPGNGILNYLVRGHIKAIAPIHAATARGTVADIRLLLDHGANPNQPGAALPTQIAVWRVTEVMETLLSAGSELNRTMSHILSPPPHVFERVDRFLPRRTALQSALIAGRAELFVLLHKAGAKMLITPVCTCGNIEELGQSQEEYDSDGSEYDSDDSEDDSDDGEDKGAYPRFAIASNRLPNNSERTIVLPEYHGPHLPLCDISNELIWNPLLQAAHCGSEDLFSTLLEQNPMGLRSRWLTEQCFASFIGNFTWGFINHHLLMGTFPVTFTWREETMFEAIREEDEEWIHKFLRDGHMTRETLQHGFVAAVELGQVQTVQLFLEEGYWPHDSCRMKLPVYDGLYKKRERSEHYYTPLGQVLHNRNAKLRDIMFRHYQELSSTHESQICAHFTEVYGIAIRHGDIGLAELAKSRGNASEVAYNGNVYDFEEYELKRFENSPKVSIHSSVQMAVAFKQYKIVRWLLDHGAHVNVSEETQDNDLAFHSPLQCAAKDGQIAIVKALLEKDANVNDMLMKLRGATALQFAAIQGNFEMLDLLLQASADINAPPCKWEGRTAIEGAAEFGRLDTVSLLLEAGADVQGRWNLNYRRTIYRAWVHGHRVLAEMIQQWKREKFGDGDCEQTASIVDSMDLETLGYSEEDMMEEQSSYYRPCVVCTRKFE